MSKAMVWGARNAVRDLPIASPMMLRTGMHHPGVMGMGPGRRAALMSAAGDSGELAAAQGRGYLPEPVSDHADLHTSADNVVPGATDATPKERGFWQGGWGQGIKVGGAAMLYNFAFGDRSLSGTLKTGVAFAAIALPVMNSENGWQRMIDGTGTIFRGIADGAKTGDWSGLQNGFGQIGGVYQEGVKNLTGLDLGGLTGQRNAAPAADTNLALGRRTLDAHLATAPEPAKLTGPQVPVTPA